MIEVYYVEVCFSHISGNSPNFKYPSKFVKIWRNCPCVRNLC